MNSNFEREFERQGFTQLTAIQEAVYQPLAAGRSVLGLAPTGSGKTLAYAWPLLENLLPHDGVQLVIMAPSQELAMQITDVLREWVKLVDLQVTPLIGGANLKRQIEKLKKHPEVVVGTPGRILNLINQRKLKMHKVQAVVIDEADEMLDSEKMPICREIIGHTVADVQLAFFSATDAPILHKIHQWFGIEPQIIDVRTSDDSQGHVDHYLIETPTRKRADMLRRLAHVKKMRGLVFFNQAAVANEVTQKLLHSHVKVALLSGDEHKAQRVQALKQFRQGKITFLLTTDVAARGLDIPDLPAVINFDLPKDMNTYVHRVGRTGRMGASGMVVNLGNEHDLRQFKQLMRPAAVQPVTAYIFENQIVTTKPETPVKKRTPRQGYRSRLNNNGAKKPKKKRRLRDQKNKGKRKKK